MGVVRLTRMIGAAALWGVGVALVATASWVAIDSAGRQVVDSAAVGGNRIGDGVSVPQSQEPTTGVPSGKPSSRPRPVTRHPSSTIGVTASQNPSSSVPTSTRPPGVTSESRPGQAGPLPVSNTLATVGGVLWLQCTGPSVTDFLAQPGSDWSASAGPHSSGQLEIHFTQGRSSIQAMGVCRDGEPVFSVRIDRSPGGFPLIGPPFP
jgi:hypothetical protein